MNPAISLAISAERGRDMREQAAAWRRTREVRSLRAPTRLLAVPSRALAQPVSRQVRGETAARSC
jgi:hypothetical protein